MGDLKQAYRALDPAAPAAPDVYVARSSDPVGRLAEELQIRETPMRVLISGQRGVGKTTEILRLSDNLSATGLLSAFANVNEEKVDDPHLMLMGMATHFGKRFLPPNTKAQVEISKFASRETSSRNFAPHLSKALKDVVEEILSANGMFSILLDGLEKLAPSNVATVVSYVANWPCSLVIVVPVPLLLSPEYSEYIAEWDRTIPLPAISLRTRGGVPEPSGLALLRSVVGHRVGNDVFATAALDLVIDASAGIHRELLALAQQACLRAAMAGCSQVREEDARAAVEDKRQEMSFHLTPQDIEYLAQLERVQRLTADPRALPLLNRNLIVSYHDDWTWFDVHPLIKPLLPKPRAARRAAG